MTIGEWEQSYICNIYIWATATGSDNVFIMKFNNGLRVGGGEGGGVGGGGERFVCEGECA